MASRCRACGGADPCDQLPDVIALTCPFGTLEAPLRLIKASPAAGLQPSSGPAAARRLSGKHRYISSWYEVSTSRNAAAPSGGNLPTSRWSPGRASPAGELVTIAPVLSRTSSSPTMPVRECHFVHYKLFFSYSVNIRLVSVVRG